jgi:serine/threonine protein kinase
MMENEETASARGRVGSTLGDYALERLLGVGRLGAVYAARSPRHGLVALKLLHSALAGEVGPALPDAERVVGEVAHARVPRVVEVTTLGGLPALVLALVEGESVASLLGRRKGGVPPAEALRIAGDALEVIAEAHRKSVVHGVLVPGHLLLSDDGSVHVLGFGESRLRSLARLPRDPAFAPPEASDAAAAAPSDDHWAIAAILFSLLTGISVLGGPLGEPADGRQRKRRARALGEVSEHAPTLLAELVDRALAPDVGRRFSQASTLLAAIRDASLRREVHYAHALGSALAEESSDQPLVDISHMTAPPISPVLGSSPYHRRPSNVPDRRGTTEFQGRPRSSDVTELPRLGAAADPASRHETLESWLAPTSLVVSSSVNPTAHTLPAPGAAPFAPSVQSSPPQGVARADTHPALVLGELSPPSLRRRREADMTFGIVTADENESALLEGVFLALGGALGAQATSRGVELEALHGAVTGALEHSPSGLTCRVKQDALETSVREIWRAPGALAPAVRTLHQSGMDTLAILPGLGPQELARFVEILSHADAPNGDMVSELYDADFSCIVFCAPNLLAALDDAARPGVDAERRKLSALVSFDTSFQLEDCWQQSHGKLDGSVATLDSEIAALSRALPEMPEGDAGTQLELEMDVGAERFAGMLASALTQEDLDRAITIFGSALKSRLAELAPRDPLAALELSVAVLDALRVPETEHAGRRRQLGSTILSASTVSELFSRLTSRGAPPEQLGRLLLLLAADHAEALARALPGVVDLQLRAQILHHLELGMSGQEHALGEVASGVEASLAHELVQLLGRIDTLAARDALELCAKSAHVAVRLEALGALEGPSGERLRAELKRLLEDATPQARIVSLRAIADAQVRAAAPFMALRIRSAGFDGFPREERRALLNGLCTLAPARAETLALELLQKKAPLLGGSAHDESRLVAAEAMGRISVSPDTREALSEMANGRWGNSELRSALSEALEQNRERGARPSRFPGER